MFEREIIRLNEKSLQKRMEKMLNKVIECKKLSIFEVDLICSSVAEILIDEPNVKFIESPICILGDIHGQFQDMVELIKIHGFPGSAKYLFLGDYVDRGRHSLQCILFLLINKILYPDHLFLVRGNHEQRSINRQYGFYDETKMEYGCDHVWNSLNNLFRYFHIGCIVDRKYMCVHGGISDRLSIRNLQKVDRFTSEDADIYNDVMWSDPGSADGCIPNQRGSGVMFGTDSLKKFLMNNNLDMLIRSHQLVLSGYRFDLEGLCLTIWSAPNYMEKSENPGVVLRIEPGKPITDSSFKFYKPPFIPK